MKLTVAALILVLTCSFVQAQRDTTYYHLHSKEKWVGKVDTNGRSIGKWVHYDANGAKMEEGSFKTWKKKGKTRTCKEGFWVSYYPSGQKECEGNYVVAKRRRTSRLSAWEMEHNLGKKGFLGFHRRSYRVFIPERDGVWRCYNEDGTLAKETVYKKGREVSYHKPDTVFYPGSKEIWVGMTDENGQRTGNWVHYSANGVKIEEGGFRTAKRNGKTYEVKEGYWVYYHPNGQKHSEGNYAVTKVGRWFFVSAGGTLLRGENGSRGFYQRDDAGFRPVHDGVWKWYNEDGTLSIETLYNKGRAISK